MTRPLRAECDLGHTAQPCTPKPVPFLYPDQIWTERGRNAGSGARIRSASSLLAVVIVAASPTAPAPRRRLPCSSAGLRPRAQGEPRADRAALFREGMVLTWGFNPAEARARSTPRRADPALRVVSVGTRLVARPQHQRRHGRRRAARVQSARPRARALAKRAPGAIARCRCAVGAAPGDGRCRRDRRGAYAAPHARARPRVPADADIATLAAEALMNLHPYDWWGSDGSRALDGRDRAQLAHALGSRPASGRQPLLDSPDGGIAAAGTASRAPTGSATRARLRPPAAHAGAHLHAHRPLRRCRAASERSIAADARYIARVDAQGAYRVGYVAHNHHFLWAAAAMEGRSAVALAAARAAFPAACGPGRSDRGTGILQHYYVLPLYTLVRFGRWREILEETLPPDWTSPIRSRSGTTHAAPRFAKTGSWPRHAGSSRLESLAADPASRAARIKNINPADALVASRGYAGRRHRAGGRRTGAPSRRCPKPRLSKTASPTTSRTCGSRPTRHALGAALLAAGRAGGRRARVPRGPRALSGQRMVPCRARRRHSASRARRRPRAPRAALRLAWRDADIALTGSRF